MTIFTSHHKVITSSRSLQIRLLHQGVSRLLRHDDVDQSQNVSKSADFRCEKMHFCSSESRESRMFKISAMKTIVLKNKTKLFSTCNRSIGTQENRDMQISRRLAITDRHFRFYVFLFCIRQRWKLPAGLFPCAGALHWVSGKKLYLSSVFSSCVSRYLSFQLFPLVSS